MTRPVFCIADGSATGLVINHLLMTRPYRKEQIMVLISQILRFHPDIKSFDDFVPIIRGLGEQGEILISMDERPGFPDTPANWEFVLENAFTLGQN